MDGTIANPYEQAVRAAEARRLRDAGTLRVASLATLEAFARMDAIVPPLSVVTENTECDPTDS